LWIEDDIQRFEHRIGHGLPADYRLFLLEVNGGRTNRHYRRFRLRRGYTSLGALYSLNAYDDQDDLATAQQHYNSEAKLPAGLLEIGYDDGGSCIVIPLCGLHRSEVWYVDIEDPRPTGSNPRVEWFDRRDAWKLANSFAEFISNLMPLDKAVG
jgi:hypothetical protein